MNGRRAAVIAGVVPQLAAFVASAELLARTGLDGAHADVLAAEWAAVGALSYAGARLMTTWARPPLALWYFVTAAIGSVSAFVALAAEVATGRAGRLALAFDNAGWVIAFAGIAALAFVFPDGRLPGRRWRPVAWCGPALVIVTFVVVTFQPGAAPVPTGAKSPVSWKPLDGTLAFLTPTLVLAMAALLCALAIGVVWRYREGDPHLRQQMLWMAFGFCTVPAIIAVDGAFAFATGAPAHAGSLLFPAVYLVVAIVTANAFTRQHHNALGPVVSRSVEYAVLSISVAAVFASTIVVIGLFAGRGSSVTAVLATLAATAALAPLHRRVRLAADRWFDPDRDEARRVTLSFVDDLRAGQTRPSMIEDAFRRALADPTARVWLWLPDRDQYVAVDGSHEPQPASMQTLPVGDDNSPIARIGFDPTGRGGRTDLLDEVLECSRLAFEIARLDAALDAQLVEVERSRSLAIDAGLRERRRLERDLHDGVQQRLVSLGIRLRRLQRSLPAQAQILAPPLDAAVDEITATLTDLRAVASGVRPARLDDGLAAALQHLADGAPIDVEVRASDAGLTPLVEETAYYVACEALANTLKHADATRVVVEASIQDRMFVLTVLDDGRGGADASDGNGIRGLADRLQALGGRLTVESPSGLGTRLVAELPCGS